MELVWLVPAAGLAAVLFALWLARDVLSRDTGTPAMQEISGMIFEGAMAFLSRQYRTIAMLAVVTAVAIAIIVGSISNGVSPVVFDRTTGVLGFSKQQAIGRWEEGLLTGIAFLVGAACSALAGYIGMFIAVRSNLRTAAAAQKSLRDAITVSLRGGAVSGFLVVALSLLGVSGISGDVRTLQASDDPRAAEALELFAYRTSQAVAAHAVALEGLDALVFTAGIGEHSAEIRKMTCEGLGWLGLALDDAANARNDPWISASGSRVKLLVIPTNEEYMIAKHVASAIHAT